MCLCVQAEQAARRKAEELLAKSTESEASLNGQLEAEVKKRSKEQKQLAAQKEEVSSSVRRLGKPVQWLCAAVSVAWMDHL